MAAPCSIRITCRLGGSGNRRSLGLHRAHRGHGPRRIRAGTGHGGKGLIDELYTKYLDRAYTTSIWSELLEP